VITYPPPEPVKSAGKIPHEPRSWKIIPSLPLSANAQKAFRFPVYVPDVTDLVWFLILWFVNCKQFLPLAPWIAKVGFPVPRSQTERSID
jgi:hypothetical protein